MLLKYKRYFILLLSTLLVVCVVFGIRWYVIRLIDRFWDGGEVKCFSCEPQELFPIVERMYGVEFPNNLIDLKTARTEPHGRDVSIYYFVKFRADSDTVNSYLESIPKSLMKMKYESTDDRRKSGATPKWFKSPIKEGIIVVFTAPPAIQIYIDTSNTKDYVVYIKGFYTQRYKDHLDRMKK